MTAISLRRDRVHIPADPVPVVDVSVRVTRSSLSRRLSLRRTRDEITWPFFLASSFDLRTSAIHVRARVHARDHQREHPHKEPSSPSSSLPPLPLPPQSPPSSLLLPLPPPPHLEGEENGWGDGTPELVWKLQSPITETTPFTPRYIHQLIRYYARYLHGFRISCIPPYSSRHPVPQHPPWITRLSRLNPAVRDATMRQRCRRIRRL